MLILVPLRRGIDGDGHREVNGGSVIIGGRGLNRPCRRIEFFDVSNYGAETGRTTPWAPKTPLEVEETVDEWETYVEQRALDSMPQSMIRGLLEQIASKIDRKGPDPVLDDGKAKKVCFGTIYFLFLLLGPP